MIGDMRYPKGNFVMGIVAKVLWIHQRGIWIWSTCCTIERWAVNSHPRLHGSSGYGRWRRYSRSLYRLKKEMKRLLCAKPTLSRLVPAPKLAPQQLKNFDNKSKPTFSSVVIKYKLPAHDVIVECSLSNAREWRRGKCQWGKQRRLGYDEVHGDTNWKLLFVNLKSISHTLMIGSMILCFAL